MDKNENTCYKAKSGKTCLIRNSRDWFQLIYGGWKDAYQIMPTNGSEVKPDINNIHSTATTC